MKKPNKKKIKKKFPEPEQPQNPDFQDKIFIHSQDKEILTFLDFFNSATLFSIQLFSGFILVKPYRRYTLTISKLLDFLQYLNSFLSYKQKMHFNF